MISLGIKGRILLVALIPITGIALVLSSYFIHVQLKSLDYALNNHGQALARHLASASEYAVFSGNREVLEALAKQALSESNVVSVSISDKQGTTLLALHAEHENPQNGERQQVRVFSQPIIQQIIARLDEDEAFLAQEENTVPSQDTLGWVVVELSLDTLRAEKNESIINSILITLLGIILSVLLATRLGRGLTRPLLRLHRAVEEIQRGNLDVAIERTSEGEIGTLEEGFQSMATTLRKSRKNLQQQIDRATAGLNESLQTVEQQNEELKQARQQALAASEAKSVFLANMSHELRTPMNGILGFTRLIKKTPLSDEQRDYIETIEKSADNLLHLLNDILDISKIEAGKLTLEESVCSLRDTIDDALSLLAPAAQDKGLELVSLFYRDVPETLFTAADRVRQILLNLIGNAIKFSSEGTIVIRTMLEEESGDNVLIRIAVSDQGIGISAENQQRLFNSFEQIDDSMARQYKGAGLGLAISRSLAELLGGEIGVDSREGDGATFWFTIRCRKLAEEESHPVAMPFSGHVAAICDPNETAGLSLLHMLQASGLKVHPHRRPQELLRQLATEERIDLVVMATGLGDEAAKTLQALFKRQRQQDDFKVVLLINSVDPVTLLHVRQQYGCLCLPKPLRKQEILSALVTLLSPREAPTAALAAADDDSHDELRGYRILVAEDNQINTKLIAHILTQAGAGVTLVENGRQAIEQYARGKFDLILMDMHMPVMSGLEATQRIRRRERDHEHIPIIGLTASLVDTEQDSYFQAGIDAMLVKPVDNRRLIALIREFCERPATLREGDVRVTPPSSGGGNPPAASMQASLTAMLVAEIPAVRSRLRGAHEARDRQQLQELVHRFLGGLAYCDAGALRAATERLHRHLLARADDGIIADALAGVLAEMDGLLAQHARRPSP